MKQLTSKTFNTNQELIWFYMKSHLLGVFLVFSLAVLLGFFASLVVAMVGPGFKVLMLSDRSVLLTLENLLGSRWATTLSFLGMPESFTADTMLSYLPISLVTIAFFKATFYLSQWYAWEKIGEKISVRIRNEIVERALELNPSRRSEKDALQVEANLASTVSTDIRLLREYIVHFYGGMPRELIQAVFMFVSLYWLSSDLFWVFLAGVLPSVILIQRLGRKLKKRASKALDNYSELTEWLQQRLLGVGTIKHFKREDFEAKNLVDLTSKLFKDFYRAARVKARTGPLVESVAIIAIAFVFSIALNSVSNGDISASIVMSFFSTLGLLSQSVNKLGRYFNSNREGAAAVSRIKEQFEKLELLQQKIYPRSENIEKSFDSPSQNPTLKIENLHVSYGKQKALEGFSYAFEGGNIYVIAGRSGAGKSTLMRSILGLQEHHSGIISYHYLDLFRCMPEYKQIGYVPQAMDLPELTLAQCVSYPEDPEFVKVREALKEVALDDLENRTSLKLDVLIGGEGLTLSGGQLQRVLLARIFYHKPPVILLDEATSALDPESEKLIYDSLTHLKERNHLVIMIAHKISSFEVANKILFLEDHKLSTQGDRDVVKGQILQKLQS